VQSALPSTHNIGFVNAAAHTAHLVDAAWHHLMEAMGHVQYGLPLQRGVNAR
jgi:hypothetical protein